MAYSLANSFAGESFLSNFNWFDGHDPTRGFVSYQNRANAEAKGLFSVDEDTGVVRLGVDHTNTYGTNEGRPIWLYGDNWPNGGEVDIIEGINTAHQNSIAAHTTNGCTLDSSSGEVFSGEKQQTDCTTGGGNVGCGFGSPANATSSYGDGFNAVNGGVYAVDWNSRHVKVWHFERGEIPSDIEAKRPDPTKWKAPVAVFGGSSCNVDSFFKDMRLVINTNFCGDWGDAIWGKTDQCSTFAPTCSEYVAKSPEAFANAYWDVRYIDTYQFSDDTTDVRPEVGIARAAFVAAAPSSAAPSAMPSSAAPSSAIMLMAAKTAKGSKAANASGASRTSAPAASKTPTSTGSLSSGLAAPSQNESSPVQTSANPSKIGKYAYLGCFGSRTGFQTFNVAKESDKMTLELCVELCDGKKFAGVFEGKCLCAEALDADTRAMAFEEGAVCDHPCPGNEEEYCGGIRERTAGMGNNSSMAPEQPRFINGTVMHYVRTPAGRIGRRNLPGANLLSVYGDVTELDSPEAVAALPPPMAFAGMGTGTRPIPLLTATAYGTVYSLRSSTVYRTVYPLQSATAYRTVHSLRSATVYRTVYPLHSTPAPMSKRMMYGAKPKFTYRDLPKASSATPNYPTPPAALADHRKISSPAEFTPPPVIVVGNRPGFPSAAANRPNPLSAAPNEPDFPSVAANVPVLPGAPTNKAELPAVVVNDPRISSPVAYVAVPLRALANPAALKSAVAAAQQTPSIVTVYIKECDASQGAQNRVPAEALPTIVPPQVPQQMAAGNRVARPMTPESVSEIIPPALGQAPQNSRHSRSPDSADSSKADGKPANSGDLESSEEFVGPEGSGKPGDPASSDVSRASSDSAMPGPMGRPNSSQISAQSPALGESQSLEGPEEAGNSMGKPSESHRSGKSPTLGELQSPEGSRGAGDSTGLGAPGNRNSKNAEGSREPPSPERALAAEAAPVPLPVLVASARGIRDTLTLAATLCAAALAVAMVL